MANEITTTILGDSTFAAWFSSMILEEARPYNVMRPFFRYAGGEKSNAYSFPIQDKPAISASYTEGTGLANAAQTDSKATATAGVFGQMATVTDEAQETTVYDAAAQYSGVLGRSTAEKFETDATALTAAFSNTSNTAGVPLTYSTLLAAINGLEQRDQKGTAVLVLDPAQVGQVRQDIGTSGAALFGNSSVDVNGTQSATMGGYAGFSVGSNVPVFQSSLVNATGGGVFLTNQALGLYEIRAPRTETIRRPELPGLVIVNTTRYGMIEIRDASGQTVLI